MGQAAGTPSAPGEPAAAGRSGNGLAVAALVVGIIGVLAGIIPLLFFFAWVLGALALVFGFAGRGVVKRNPQRTGKGMATAGIVLGAAAVALGIVGVVIVANVFDDVDEALDEVGGTADPDTYELAEGDCAVDQFGFATFTGTIENTADEPRSYSIDVEFLDPAGTRIGDGVDIVENLRPGAEANWEGTDAIGDGTVVCEVARVENFFN